MENVLKELLENAAFGDDVKTALQEAFNSKIKDTEAKLQEAYASRYQHDKDVLVEAIDNMISDAITTELSEFKADRAATIAQKAKFTKATLSAKKVYETKLNEHVKMIDEFIKRELKEEVQDFANDRKKLATQRKQMAQEVRTIKENSKKQFAHRIEMLENFIMKTLSEEISEMQADKRALVEKRVKLTAEGKKKIQETKIKFIKNASQLVNKTLNEAIRNELEQWRDDIKVARENNFGRRIFEAVASEYMASYLSEGSEIKKLQKTLAETEQKLVEAKTDSNKQRKLTESVAAEAKAAKDRAARLETLNEILAPLGRDKKAVMEEMLKDVRTVNLKEAFNRYLPAVINGNNNSNHSKTLTENTKSVSVTGDRKTTLTETNRNDLATDNDIASILHLAGIKNKG